MLRILPITLVAVLMVLPLRLGSLIEGFPAIAQQFDREFGAHERPWAKDLKSEAAAPPPAADSPPPAAAPAIALTSPSCDDPLLRAAINEQKAENQAHSRYVSDAGAALGAIETRVATQIDRLNAAKREVESLMKQRSTLQQEDIRRMVAIYEAMKPRDAARIFSDLETDIVIDVLDRMAERRSAPIIAELEDGKAREVTRIIMQRRALPGDRTAPRPTAVAATPPPMANRTSTRSNPK